MNADLQLTTVMRMLSAQIQMEVMNANARQVLLVLEQYVSVSSITINYA